MKEYEIKREYEFDYLRSIAAFGVIVIHVCAMDWRNLDIYSSYWLTIHIYDMMAKFSVPIFFMISGRFFLDPIRSFEFNKMIRKIKHLILVFSFWSCIYMILNVLRVLVTGGIIRENIKWIILEFFGGEYHMWFLYAIIGLYLITPLLRKIVEDKRTIEYFLILFFVFSLILPILEKLPRVGIVLSTISDEMVFHFTLGYSGYYILGYYLYAYRFSKNKRKKIYILGIVGIFMSCMLTYISSIQTGIANEELANYLSPNVAITAIAVYVFAMEKGKIIVGKKGIELIASSSLGIYMIHPVFLWIFEWFGFTQKNFIPIISVPVIASAVLIISLIFIQIMSKNLYLRKVI